MDFHGWWIKEIPSYWRKILGAFMFFPLVFYSWRLNRIIKKRKPLSSRWFVLGSVPTTCVFSDICSIQMPPSEQRRVVTKRGWGAGEQRASYTPDSHSCLASILPLRVSRTDWLAHWMTVPLPSWLFLYAAPTINAAAATQGGVRSGEGPRLVLNLNNTTGW